MAQVMVNFRMDEELKKSMELACREMGLSMTTAFTIFAKKVAKEKRIPFEITAQPYPPRRWEPEHGPAQGEDPLGLARRQAQLERLCGEIRRSLTAIHTAIPASVTGLSMERIRLLCGDELKDKAAGISSAAKALFSARNADTLGEKDLRVLDEYIDGLSSAARELAELERTLIPAMKSRSGEDSGSWEPFVQQLVGVSRQLDGLPAVMRRFLASTSCDGSARGVGARLRRSAQPVETAYVRSAVDGLEELLLRDYDFLTDAAKARLESDYLPTLELTLRELSRSEQQGGDADEKAALCLRVVNVLSQVISDGRQTRQEWSRRSLEAEVAALERLTALRGDAAGGLIPGG